MNFVENQEMMHIVGKGVVSLRAKIDIWLNPKIMFIYSHFLVSTNAMFLLTVLFLVSIFLIYQLAALGKFTATVEGTALLTFW